jgi:hypothetical protein
LTIYVPSLALGLLTGTAIVALQATNPLKGALVFYCGFLIVTMVAGLYEGSMIAYLPNMLSSVGNWLFIVGAAIVPLAVWGRKRVG